jgi:hypothetical protein
MSSSSGICVSDSATIKRDPIDEPIGAGQADALDFYRSLPPSSLDWSYVSPPPIHFAPGERRGQYRTGEDQPVVDEPGESRISYEDFAMAIVDEIERPRFSRKRFTVGYLSARTCAVTDRTLTAAAAANRTASRLRASRTRRDRDRARR